MNKSELLNWMREEYQRWRAFLDQIDEARMEQPGLNGNWSMKDMVAHLTGWQPRLTARIQAAQDSEAEPPSPWPPHVQSEDEINAWIYESNRRRSVREVLDEMEAVFQQFLSVLEGLPDNVRIEQLREGERVFNLVWLGDQRYPVGEFFDHFYDDHEPDVRTWLERTEKRSLRTNTPE